MDHTVLLALGLTMIAGLSTGIGSLIAFFTKRTNTKFLSAALGLSAGVMIYVSFMELMPQSVELLSGIYSKKESEVYMLLSFFAGIGLIALIDRLVPADENPHEIHTDKEFGQSAPLKRTGILMAFEHRHCPAHRVCHSHPQHPRRNSRLRSHLSLHGEPSQGLLVFVSFRHGRTSRRAGRFSIPSFFLDTVP